MLHLEKDNFNRVVLKTVSVIENWCETQSIKPLKASIAPINTQIVHKDCDLSFWESLLELLKEQKKLVNVNTLTVAFIKKIRALK